MKTIEDIILEKNYGDLSAEELTLVGELADSEEEFNQMKQLFENMSLEFEGAEVFTASSETKASLDQIFSAKHPVIAQEWKKEEAVAEEAKVIPFYNRNWVRAAAILLLFVSISIPFIQNSDELSKSESVKQASNNESNLSEKSAVKAEEKSGTQATVIYPNTDKKESTVLAFAEDQDAGMSVETYDKYIAAEPSETDDHIVSGEATTTLSPVTVTTYNAAPTTYSFSSASSSQPTTYTNSGTAYIGTVHEMEKDKKSNWGRIADLDPELNMSQPTTASANTESSVSKEALAAEMLDWIQAAY